MVITAEYINKIKLFKDIPSTKIENKNVSLL